MSRLKRSQGQSLVLACLMMLVLCVSVLATVNIGHAVEQRIGLQNTADAAAYSMAAMEARAFNFYAFVNRTHVSHYVSAMVWQSYLSFIYFTEAFLTDVYGIFKTLNKCGGQRDIFWTAACPVLERAPYAGPIVSVLSRLMSVYRVFLISYQRALRALDPDRWIGRLIIPAHRKLNQALTAAADAVMMGTLDQLLNTADGVVRRNDPRLAAQATRVSSGLLTACLFDRAHFREANGGPLSPSVPQGALEPSEIREDSKVARAKRVMGGIANATRFSCDSDGDKCPSGMVTYRKLGDLLPLPNSIQPVRRLLDWMPKWGQTRLLSYSLAKGFEDADGGNLIRHWRDPPHFPQGMLAQGDNLGADDLYSIKLGPSGIGPFRNPFACGDHDNYWECWGDPRHGKGRDGSLPYRYMMKTSIWALNSEEHRGGDGGVHWRVSYRRWPTGKGQKDPEGEEAELGLHKSSICVVRTGCLLGQGVSVDVYVANVRPIQDGNHPWGGIVPFMHFEPGQYEKACPGSHAPSATEAATRREEFNQPSTWIALSQGVGPLASAASKWVGSSDNSASLGFNAISRGQVYYHRPGNWTEQPNFFNPYWRARLASVYQGRLSFPQWGQLLEGLPPPLRGSPEKVMTH